MHIVVNRSSAVLVGALALVATGLAGCADQAPQPTSSSMAAAKAPSCLPKGAQAVDVDVDGYSTPVAVVGGGTKGVVLAPQNHGDWCQWGDEIGHLADEGYRVATFTWADDGPDAGKASMRAAAQSLRTAGATELALVGASKGGTYAVAMADELDAKGVVVLSPPATFDGLSARSAAVTYTGPLLVLASRDDTDVPRDESYQVARPDDGPSFLEIPLAAHGVAMLADPGHAEHVTFAIDDELTRSFGGQG
ncbi:alpha/beta hydrolase [Cellulomonas sp. HZM]|uniref:alpha/beta hydrolase n=1 Tax=Cellulomonas sp. HZM TaxID=1454010 RepID=UPI0004936684|nr:alpha/beta hydrolase [Cellulomonas sp. HZM]